MPADMKITFVLVHGGTISTETWNRLAGREEYPQGGQLGGAVWDTITPYLKAYHYRVYAPTLKDEHTCNLTGHIDQVSSLITVNDLSGIILVGHSYGGMVITGVAARIPERIRRLVYLDAALPDPRESLFDLIASGGLDPMAIPGLEPAAAYVEKIQFDPWKIQRLPKTYILCTKSEFAPVTHVAKQKIVVSGEEWTWRELPSSHVPQASMPGPFLELLLEAARM